MNLASRHVASAGWPAGASFQRGWLVFHDVIWRWTDGHGEERMKDCLIAFVREDAKLTRREREKGSEKENGLMSE